MQLDTLGIMNGCIDLISQQLSNPEIAYNNTYGIQAIDEGLYEEAVDNFLRDKTGCLALTLKCQSLAEKFDPHGYGNDEEVSTACAEASDYCTAHVEAQYDTSGRSLFDMAAPWRRQITPPYYLGFLSQPWVQAALGVSVNFTQRASASVQAFNWTGDYARKDGRGGQLGDIASLLDKGVKVALFYGDRDYSCNCKSVQPRKYISSG
jgi:carboxypeptidase D